MMIFVNHFTGVNPRPLQAIRILLQLLNPFAPHLTEELWERIAGLDPSPAAPGELLAHVPWPGYDPALLVEDELELPVQINGKVRDKIIVKKDATKEETERAALAAREIGKWTEGKTVKKIVVVPGKLVNIVVG